MPKIEDVHINPLGFREYDARWLYPDDINLEGIKSVGQGQIFIHKVSILLDFCIKTTICCVHNVLIYYMF